MTEFLTAIDLDINVIDSDVVLVAFVCVNLRNTITFNKLLILSSRFLFLYNSYVILSFLK